MMLGEAVWRDPGGFLRSDTSQSVQSDSVRRGECGSYCHFWSGMSGADEYSDDKESGRGFDSQGE